MSVRVVWLTELGGPDVLVPGDAPDPTPGPGQVVVDVAYAKVTFVETQFRATGFGPFTPEPPMVMGNGVGGVVTAVGAGVDGGLVGRRVVAGTGGSGGYAERVAVEAAAVVDVPDGLGLDTAVAVMADGRTALLLVRAAGLRDGDRVLVEAAAGGVGTLLVQLATAAGAWVVAAADGEPKTRLAFDLGADVAVDYREPGWTGTVRDAAGPLDVVFDGVGGAVGRAAFELLGPGGRMLSYGPGERRVGRSLRGTGEPARRRAGAGVRHAGRAARAHRPGTRGRANGRLRPVIGQRFPLERAADAHAAIESRATVGKTLLVAAAPADEFT
ncbi:MAG: zinc-binding dehydrogenase [Acidothermales bacterium]|nr:zinc-binding dehydrogenase [Acidothermales bacterium]